MSDKSTFVVDADWLQSRLGTPGISIVDASWYLPAAKRDPKAEYDAAHIPGAVFFDHEAISDPQGKFPHTFPTAQHFARLVGGMGISADDTIVVYDGPGYMSAPRAWWLFRVMGVFQVYILDGGFDRWKAEGRPVTSDVTKVAPCIFHVDADDHPAVRLDEMKTLVAEGAVQVADARAAGRFSGDEPEPRPGLKSGHMPGARNVPSSSLSRNGELLPVDELRAVLEKAGLDLDKPVVTSCGSGITAAVISLALQSVGHKDNRLYDGSWTEWASQSDTPIVTGKA